MSERKQINVRLDDETLEAIDYVRAQTRPIPSVSDMIRAAIIAQRDAIKKKGARK